MQSRTLNNYNSSRSYWANWAAPSSAAHAWRGLYQNSRGAGRLSAGPYYELADFHRKERAALIRPWPAYAATSIRARPGAPLARDSKIHQRAFVLAFGGATSILPAPRGLGGRRGRCPWGEWLVGLALPGALQHSLGLSSALEHSAANPTLPPLLNPPHNIFLPFPLSVSIVLSLAPSSGTVQFPKGHATLKASLAGIGCVNAGSTHFAVEA